MSAVLKWRGILQSEMLASLWNKRVLGLGFRIRVNTVAIQSFHDLKYLAPWELWHCRVARSCRICSTHHYPPEGRVLGMGSWFS